MATGKGRASVGGAVRPSIIEKRSMREQVHEYLREEILSGRLAQGARLVETQIAAELGISRTPVREAIPILENEGLVEGSQGAGYRVRAVSWSEVEELCAMRVVNESLAAVWAVERITEDTLKAMELNLREAETEIRRGSPESFVEKDAEFHEMLIRASGSRRMFDFCQILRGHMIRYRVQSFRNPDETLLAFAGHVRIFEALKARDVTALQRAVKDHIEVAREVIRRCAFAQEREAASA